MEDFYSHYTNVKAFKEIISNNSIRMTRSDFLNDPTDCRLFITLVDQYIKKHPEIFQYAISFVANKNKNEVEKVYKNGCDVVNYMEHIHKCVPLYVMSLTQTHDDMNMWNCYGQGGMELKFSIDELIKSLKETFTYDYDKQFLTEAPVIYADNKSKVEQIKVPPFKDFTLMNKGSDNVFEDHRKTMNASSSRYGTQLYDTTELNIFIESYVRSHVETLEYLLENEKISEDMSAVQVFSEVFNNHSRLYGDMYWKHDLSLYMLLLSALIKSSTYKHEDEHRVVYFDYNLENKNQEEYFVKHITSGDFICPYITFKKNNGNDLLQSSLKEITISPHTKNLPINNNIYKETLKNFISGKGFANVEVQYSEHSIRW